MERSQAFTVWITTTTFLSICNSPVWAAAGPEQIRACTNAVVVELQGVPRSEVTVTADPANNSEFVNWQTKDGRAGFCRVEPDGSVDQFGIDQAAITNPDPVSTYTIPDRSGALVTVTTDSGELNVRQSPGGEIIRTVPNGDSLTLTGQTSGEWVELEGGGWVSRFLVTPVDSGTSLSFNLHHASPESSSSPASPNQVISSNQAIVATGGAGLYVRQTANGEIVGSIADGSVVTLTGQRSGEWVELEGGGWVSEAYLQY